MTEQAEYITDAAEMLGAGQAEHEQQALNQYAAIKHASEDVIGVNRVYLEMVDYDHEAALVLDEVMFWTLPQKRTGKTGLRVKRDGYMWLAVSRTEWKERKGLLERQADRAVNKLIELKLIVKDNFYFDGRPRVHLRVSSLDFFAAYSRVMALRYTPDEDVANPEKSLEDLYIMMGMSNLPNGNLPKRESNLPNGESINLPNGDFINSPDSPDSTLPVDKFQKIKEAADKTVDAIIELGNMPGAKAFVRRQGVAARIEKLFGGRKPTGKQGVAFVEFVDKMEQDKRQTWEEFARWMVSQSGYDPQYWGWVRMQENWGCAFEKKKAPEMELIF